MQNLMENFKSLHNVDIPFRTENIHYYVTIGVTCTYMVIFTGPVTLY